MYEFLKQFRNILEFYCEVESSAFQNVSKGCWKLSFKRAKYWVGGQTVKVISDEGIQFCD